MTAIRIFLVILGLSAITSSPRPTNGNRSNTDLAALLAFKGQLSDPHGVLAAEDWLNPDAIKGVFEARALRMAVNCAQNISKAPSQEEGFSELSPDLLEAAVAQVQLIIVTKFIEKLHEDIPGPGVKEQLQNLCSIYTLHLLHKHLGDFLSTGCVTARQGALANEQLGKLYAQVRIKAN